MQITALSYGQLDGWAADDHAAALGVIARSCGLARMGAPALGLTPDDWTQACDGAATAARSQATATAFFAARFVPVLVEGGAPPLFTGYYEPELTAAARPQGRYRHPIYRLPSDHPGEGIPWLTRGDIARGALDGKGFELAWLADPVDAYFLQIQGSGRLRMTNGAVMRVGYAAKNGRPYVSIGQIMKAEGTLGSGPITADAIKDWARANPSNAQALMNRNPSYVFFQPAEGLTAGDGPRGALALPLTAMRSAAVDPAIAPLGAPIWVETEGPDGPIRRLFAAQDTGSAIKGAQRADLFFGTGDDAGRRAGQMQTGGRLVLLLPRAAVARLGLIADGR
ncbi:MAG: membrane-bound lytic murein transglycosylase A [Paracoccaceae bacterium]|jgi:membrane-bound lytic murein transglycosylase A